MLEKQHEWQGEPGVQVRTPAKINLSLVVFGPRSDGYHELHTVMGTVGLYDDLEIRPGHGEGIELVCSGIASPAGGENIVAQAAELLGQRVGRAPDIRIHLHKRIPLGAGLAGGSSDAAACLWGLNQFWELGLSVGELSIVASQLGSDVPFFLQAPVALCTGRGEIVKPIPQRCTRYVLLIFPSLQVPTARVYEQYQYDPQQTDKAMKRVDYYLRRGDLNGLVAQGINSLTEPCRELFPELRDLSNRIEGMEIGPVHMSGSGSCLFTTSDSNGQVAAWARELQQRGLAEIKRVSFQQQAEPFLEVHHADIGS